MHQEDTDNQLHNMTYNRTEYFIIPSRDLFIKCQYVGSIVTAYVDTSIGFIGIILNIICFIVFSNEAFQYPKRIKCKMFKYLLVKSIFDGLILFFKALIPVFKCEECLMNTTYVFNIFDLVINKYFMFVCTLCSIFFDLAAQFDRLITISKMFQCFNKISYKMVITSIISLISMFYTFKLLEYNIKNFEGDNSIDYNLVDIIQTNNTSQSINTKSAITFYYLFKSDFSSTRMFKHLEMAHSIIRDFLCVLFLLTVDILILIEFRLIMKNKKKILSRKNDVEISMQTNMSSNSNCTNSGFSIEYAENRTTLMTLTMGLTTLFGRLPIFINYLPINSFQLKSCYQTISETLFLTNITLSFFIYFFFNKTFKGVIYGYIFKIKNYNRVPTATATFLSTSNNASFRRHNNCSIKNHHNSNYLNSNVS